MPTWKVNILTARREKDAKAICEGLLDGQGKADFNKLIPIPEGGGWQEMKESWGVYANATNTVGFGKSIWFDTPWYAPMPVIDALGKLADFDYCFLDDYQGENGGKYRYRDGTRYTVLCEAAMKDEYERIRAYSQGNLYIGDAIKLAKAARTSLSDFEINRIYFLIRAHAL